MPEVQCLSAWQSERDSATFQWRNAGLRGAHALFRPAGLGVWELLLCAESQMSQGLGGQLATGFDGFGQERFRTRLHAHADAPAPETTTPSFLLESIAGACNSNLSISIRV